MALTAQNMILLKSRGRLVRRGGFSLPVTFQWTAWVGRASPRAAFRVRSTFFFSRIQIFDSTGSSH